MARNSTTKGPWRKVAFDESQITIWPQGVGSLIAIVSIGEDAPKEAPQNLKAIHKVPEMLALLTETCGVLPKDSPLRDKIQMLLDHIEIE